MGLIHSGALTDLAFSSLVESKFNLSKLGALSFLRFRDDIFTASKSKDCATAALQDIPKNGQATLESC